MLCCVVLGFNVLRRIEEAPLFKLLKIVDFDLLGIIPQVRSEILIYLSARLVKCRECNCIFHKN